MAYVENPIVEGKDFESVAKDVNGNFENIKDEISQTDQALSKWEFIGETDIIGTPTTNGGDYANRLQGAECGSINCEGKNYEKLLLLLSGNVGSYTHLKTNMVGHNDAGNSFYIAVHNGEQIYYSVGDGYFMNLPNADIVAKGFYADGVTFYWNYYDDYTPGETNVNIKLYGLKKPQWLLDALEIT